MAVIKTLHVLCVFIWIGNLLSLTRLMGYQVSEDEHTQMRMARIYKRMYNFVGLPTLTLSVAFGAILISQVDQDKGILWFIYKMIFAVGLIVCDVVCGQFIAELNVKPEAGKGVKFKILHGVAGLLLIGALVSIYVFRP